MSNNRALSTQVLRAVVIQHQPRLLGRPSRSERPKAPSDSLLPAESTPATVVSPEAIDQDAQARGYEEGLARGKEQGFNTAFEQGLNEGYEQGLKEGRAAGQQAAEHAALEAIQSRLSLLDQWMQALPDQLNLRLRHVEEDMVALSYEAVCQIIGTAHISLSGVRELIKVALDQAQGRPLVAVHVHPDDLLLLEQDVVIATWLLERSASSQIRWVSDSSVKLGGVMLRSPDGCLDARLETQLNGLRQMLVTVRQERMQSLVDLPGIKSNPHANEIPLASPLQRQDT